MVLVPTLLIILAALAGLALAGYIHRKKRQAKPLVCPLKADCESVVHSEFSRFFGIPIEILGMAYYALLAVSYSILIVFPALAIPVIVFVLLTLTCAAFLFSLYLTFIQAFAIKQWCSWCLVSAMLCTIIFVLTTTSSALGFVPLLAHNRELLLVIHLFGLVLGLGGAIITDILFFRFLRDLRISVFEADVMRTLSQVIWLGLAILVMSGVGNYLPQMDGLNASAKFLVKVTVVTVILINGAFLNLVISPRLVSMSFGALPPDKAVKMARFRRLAFALGAISFTSWYTAFVLGLMPAVPLGYGPLLSIYLLVLAVTVTGSQIMERRLRRSAG